MKTTYTKLKVRGISRMFRWAAFIAACCSMLALLAVLTGMYRGNMVAVPPKALDQGQYYAGTVDMSQLFRMR